MKITPIQNQPSVAMAVAADEENVIATKNDLDTAPREDDEAFLHSSSRWTICLVAGLIALVAAVAVFVALPLVNTRDAALQITFSMNQSGHNETRIIKTITSNGQHGICSIDEQGVIITYIPNEGFFGTDTCTYTLSDNTEETITVVVTDLDAPVTSPDAMVLVSEDRSVNSTISTTTASTTPIQTATTSSDTEGGAASATTTTSVPTTTAMTEDSVCTECSIRNDTQNFCGQLGIYTFVDACESQTECKEQGLGCKVCAAVDGFEGDVGSGAYICVEEEEADKATSTTTTSATATASSTTTSSATSTTTMAEASEGGIESLIGTKWKATEIRWRTEELKETTEEDRNPIILLFDSDTRVSGTCGNNSCGSVVSLRADRLRFGSFWSTKMIASDQEYNYVDLLQESTFFYEVSEEGNGLPELRLYEIDIEGGLEKQGMLMATYVQEEV